MIHYLPVFYPPHNPTHQLVYIPPTPAIPHTPNLLDTPLSPGSTSGSTSHSTSHSHSRSHLHPPASRSRSNSRSSASPYIRDSPISRKPRMTRSHGHSHDTTSAQTSSSSMPPSRSVASSETPTSRIRPFHHTLPPPCIARDHPCVLRTYEMSMRQQPLQARMCGVGDKSDRRPVDPTPIIQLKVIDKNGDDITHVDPRTRDDEAGRKALRRPDPGPGGMTFMQNPYYFLFACLVGGDELEDELHVIDDGKTRFLTGTPVSSLYHLKDLDNSDAAFFVFPDLGVRKEGRYKLKLTLFEIVDAEVYYCTTMYTSTFSVYSAKKFPGMQKATDLSKSFAEQGLKIRVRKDPRRRAVKAKRKSSAQSEDEDLYSKRTRTTPLPGGPDDPRYMHHSPEGFFPSGHPLPPQYPNYPYSQGQRMPPPPPPPPGHPGGYDHRMSHYYPPYGRPQTQAGPPRSRHSMPPGPEYYYPPGQYDRAGGAVPWPQGRAPPPPSSHQPPPPLSHPSVQSRGFPQLVPARPNSPRGQRPPSPPQRSVHSPTRPESHHNIQQRGYYDNQPSRPDSQHRVSYHGQEQPSRQLDSNTMGSGETNQQERGKSEDGLSVAVSVTSTRELGSAGLPLIFKEAEPSPLPSATSLNSTNSSGHSSLSGGVNSSVEGGAAGMSGASGTGGESRDETPPSNRMRLGHLVD
ncbi:hypothetical protein M231_02907 [Tremella mesenterica]|uniref:Velvet domain-containing protein n=1 Tax=Tremella mesenterica TaxID=5217 RepID=A0A4Q1BPT9_TREME|nr:hypothetical protein M231_02907 [Tremella mesenterica]